MTPGRLATLLAALGWSQAELARRLGHADRRTVANWCAGRRPVNPRVAEWLERVAGPLAREPVPADWVRVTPHDRAGDDDV